MKTLIKDPVLLRQPCASVSSVAEGLKIGRELLSFIRSYNKKHSNFPAIGLAAPQLGIYRKVCIVMPAGLPHVLINPVIVESSSEEVEFTERCISLPGIVVATKRNVWVEVKADNWAKTKVFGVNLKSVTGKNFNQMLLESVCCQHEYQHILGILITDIAIQK